MKLINCEVVAFPISERMRKTMNQCDQNGTHLVADSDKYANEDVLSVAGKASCGFCGREEHTRAFFVSGHTVSICSDCLATIVGRTHA
jgi:hypothetical protein